MPKRVKLCNRISPHSSCWSKKPAYFILHINPPNHGRVRIGCMNTLQPWQETIQVGNLIERWCPGGHSKKAINNIYWTHMLDTVSFMNEVKGLCGESEHILYEEPKPKKTWPSNWYKTHKKYTLNTHSGYFGSQLIRSGYFDSQLIRPAYFGSQ